MLGRIVDSVVIPPFERGAGVQINAADLKLFRDQFEEQLTARPGLKAYAAPPTTLANTVTLNGTLAAFAVHEQSADGLFLRTIDTILGLTARVGLEKQPALELSRAYSYQKLYRTTQGAAALEYDLRNAAREATGTLVAVLTPAKAEGPAPQAAVDPASGTDYSHPLLIRGIREVEHGRYGNAIGAWSTVLYNPGPPLPDGEYRVSSRMLARLTSDGAARKDLDALAPLARRGGEPLENLRERVVRALGPDSPLEAKVLQMSGENTNRIQLNLARAHYNLALVHERERRYDAAAYHWSRAHAYDPAPASLEAWLRLQAQRGLVPQDLKADAPEAVSWMRAYQRVPAPFTATVTGGTYERNVIPGPAFPSEGSPAPAAAPAVTPVALPRELPPPPDAALAPAAPAPVAPAPAAAPLAPAAQSTRSQGTRTPAQQPRTGAAPGARTPAQQAQRASN
jgi:hypothetical protein